MVQVGTYMVHNCENCTFMFWWGKVVLVHIAFFFFNLMVFESKELSSLVWLSFYSPP